jgi:hypothetical protein
MSFESTSKYQIETIRFQTAIEELTSQSDNKSRNYATPQLDKLGLRLALQSNQIGGYMEKDLTLQVHYAKWVGVLVFAFLLNFLLGMASDSDNNSAAQASISGKM